MMEMIQAEFDRSQRSEMPFSIVVIDIDDFRVLMRLLVMRKVI